MGFDGAVLSDKTQDVNIPPLSSTIYLRMPMEELSGLKGFDATTSFVAAELIVDGKSASKNLLFFQLPKDLSLPAPKISAEVTKSGDAYMVRVSTDVLARNVFLSAGDLDATYSDNFFDLLPGESATVQVKTTATLEQLRAALRAMSLVDAYKAVPAPGTAPAAAAAN